MDFVAILEAGRQDFIDAARNIAPERACARPSPDGWSALECIEHVAAVEDRWLSWIANGSPIHPDRNSRKETRLFTTIRNREGRKVEAPDAVRPRGRFATLAEAVAEFQSVRARTVELVRERGDALYSVGAKHPWFGDLNGAEWIHLIDGHARRHADQIRELAEASPAPERVRVKSTKARKPYAFHRDPPDLPAELESGRLAADGIQDQRLQDIEATNLNSASLRIEGSVLERVQLAGGQFGSAVWKDAQFTGCDLANIRAHRITLVRVELVDCRLTGFTATALDWQDVLVHRGDARYVQFQGATFRNCEFDGCNLEEADLQNADLNGCVFRSCQLARADFRGTKLQNTDFRKSEVEGMVVGMNDLRGAIVDPAQAMVFARVLGLQIL